MTENDTQPNENNAESSEPAGQTEASFTYSLNEDFKEHPVNSLPASCRRVKLYEIGSSTETWVDKGTGFCFFDGDVESKNPKLLVSLEHYGVKSLVSTYIKDNTDYSSQNGRRGSPADSIIIWHEGSDTRLYRALSFQNVVGHNACWAYIRKFVEDSNIQTGAATISVQSAEVSPNSTYRILPVPTAVAVQKLESTLDTILCQNNLADGVYMDLLDKKWLKELFELMHRSIANEDFSTVASISSILLKMLLNWCGSLELMHVLVCDEVFFDLLKAFECKRRSRADDVDLMTQNIRMEHVKFFKKFVRHHEVVQIDSPTFYQLTHANYRINYIKDVVLPRHLDEFSIQRINSTVFANMSELMNIILTEESSFFENLREKMHTNYMAAVFLRELLLTARSSNVVSQADRNALILMVRNYQILNELATYLDGSSEAIRMYEDELVPLNKQSEQYYQGIKAALSRSKRRPTDCDGHEPASDGSGGSEGPGEAGGGNADSGDYRPNLLCTNRHTLIGPLSLVVEVFHICQEIFPAIVRSAVFIDTEIHRAPKLLLGLCNVLLKVPNEGLQSQTREILSRMLDPKNMDLPEKDEICNIFYDKGVLDHLLHFLTNKYKPYEATPSSNRYDSSGESSAFSNVNTESRESEGEWSDKRMAPNTDSLSQYDSDNESYHRPPPRKTRKTAIGEIFESEDDMKDHGLDLNINAKIHIMEILSLCAREHRHRFKLRVQAEEIPVVVIKASMAPYDKFLVVGSVKFLKVLVQMKDRVVNKHIIKHNVLRFIMWVLLHRVDRHNPNGSVLESAALSLLSTIESVGADALIVYLFTDEYCTDAMNTLKKGSTCYAMLFNNLQRMFNNVNAKGSFDENRWFEDDDEDEELSVAPKHKIVPETLIQDNILTLFNSASSASIYDDDFGLPDKWLVNNKLQVTNNIASNETANARITVKLKPPKGRSRATRRRGQHRRRVCARLARAGQLMSLHILHAEQ